MKSNRCLPFAGWVFFLFLHAAAVDAQFEGVPHWDWRVTETTHFRIFFPGCFEEWTVAVASRMESIHEEVTAIVGYRPDRRVDVLVMDPMGAANGMALPLMNAPRIVLWASAPDAASSLTGYTDWGELVGSHEFAHIAHMIRPSRNMVDRMIAWLVPIGPIAMKAPTWLTEGYAVVLEGKLTGSGRPFTSFRSAVLRQWAIEGRLPDYAALSGSDVWMGYSMPYLVGSAFLEWLEHHSGDSEIWTKLWRRMTARQRRSFDESFSGLFGDSAETLYNRFRAELTAAAIEFERDAADALRTGELWRIASEATDAPDIAPDGSRMALLTRAAHRPPSLVVLSMTEADESEVRREETRRKALEKDPEDVPDITTGPPVRKELARFPSCTGLNPSDPRWMPDGKAILFDALVRDHDGMLHPDLFVWEVDSGDYRRISVNADLRQADPAPDGRWLVAVRQQFGRSELVRLDLPSAVLTAVVPPSIDRSLTSPRVSPDGTWIAVIESAKTYCRVRLIDSVTGEIRDIPSLPRENIMHLEWIAPDRVLVVSDRSGIPNLEILEISEEMDRIPLTSVLGGAAGPAFDPVEGMVYFMNLTTGGLELRRIPLEVDSPDQPEFRRPNWVMPPVEYPDLVTHRRDPIEIDVFRANRHQEFRMLLGGNWLPMGDTVEIGFRSGDLVGRFDGLAVGSVGWNGGASGGTIGASYRGWPVALGIQGYYSERSPADQRDIPEESELRDVTLLGAQFSADRRVAFRNGSASILLGGLSERIDVEGAESSLDRQLLSFRVGADGAWRFGSVATGIGFHAASQAGTIESGDWTQALGHLYTTVQHLDAGYLRFDLYEGRTWGEDHWTNRFSPGGMTTSLDSTADIRTLLRLPYLPAFRDSGSAMRHMRIEAGLAGFAPFVFFAERTDLWEESSGEGRMRAAGMELTSETPPMPIVKFPALGMRAGVAHLWDGEQRGGWRGYVSLIYRP